MNRSRFPIIQTFKHFLPLKPYFVQNRGFLALGITCLLLVDFLQLLIPLVIKRAVDAMTTGEAAPPLLLHYALLIMAVASAMALLRYFWRLFLMGHSRKVEEGLRNRLYAHLQTLSTSFYHRTRTGDLMARAINDLNAVRMAAGMGLVAMTDALVLGLAAMGFMIHIHPTLTLISLMPAPVIIYLTRFLTRRMSIGYERVQSSFSEMTEGVREAFSGIRVIKAYARERWIQEKIRQNGARYISENMTLARSVALFFPLMVIFTNLGLAIVIFFGGRLTIFGQITTGDFVAFTTYLNLLTWPMMAMGWVTNLIQRGAASMRRINRVLEARPEIGDPAVPAKISGIRGHIRFEGVDFRYTGKGGKALDRIDLTIREGRNVALVGRVGSGKSTLLQCIPRLLDVTAGRLFIDGEDVRSLSLRTLRNHIGFVTQETIVFSDTIRNNVLFGREPVSEEALVTALKTAQAYEEFMDFKKGLHTMVGEKGITLSGGQRQRLTIARALLENPPVLILDDALSMVDTETEEKILDRILLYREGKTNIMVSHRVSTISRADLIVVLEKGRVAEIGDHGSLMKRGQVYTRLYQRQLLAQELESTFL